MLIIPDLFSPYLDGVETARKANWDDMNQYNAVQNGQLNNFLNLATLSPRINREYENTDAAALNNLYNETTFNNRVARDSMNTQLDQYKVNTGYYNDQLQGAAFPGQYVKQVALSNANQQYADPLAQHTMMAQDTQLRNVISGNNPVSSTQLQQMPTQSGNGMIPSSNATSQGLEIPTLQNPNHPVGQAGPRVPSFEQTSFNSPVNIQSMPQQSMPQQSMPQQSMPQQSMTQQGGTNALSVPPVPTPSQQRLAQIDSERQTQLGKLAEAGITPHTRNSFKIPGIQPDGNMFSGFSYNLPSSTEPRPLLQGILDLPKVSYVPDNEIQAYQTMNNTYGGAGAAFAPPSHTPITDNPSQEYRSMPFSDLESKGITLENLKSMPVGSHIIGQNNMMVTRDPSGFYWATGINKSSGGATYSVPIDVPTDAAAAQKK